MIIKQNSVFGKFLSLSTIYQRDIMNHRWYNKNEKFTSDSCAVFTYMLQALWCLIMKSIPFVGMGFVIFMLMVTVFIPAGAQLLLLGDNPFMLDMLSWFELMVSGIVGFVAIIGGSLLFLGAVGGVVYLADRAYRRIRNPESSTMINVVEIIKAKTKKYCFKIDFE